MRYGFCLVLQGVMKSLYVCIHLATELGVINSNTAIASYLLEVSCSGQFTICNENMRHLLLLHATSIRHEHVSAW